MVKATVNLPDDPEEASKHYMRVRQCVREAFQNFLRDLSSQSLRWLEQQFEKNGGELNFGTFLRVFSRVFAQPQAQNGLSQEEHQFVIHLAIKMLFEGMDVDRSGEASWMEFVEFVCAIAEELRLQAQELSWQTFDFDLSSISAPYRPAITKCHFDKVFFWPDHPLESAVIFEEGQTGFHLHRPTTLARKRRVDGHTNELLAAAFLPKPFQWVVTSGNDSNLCFWDESFKLIKKCKAKHVIGELCWCHDVRVLYTAKASLYDPAIETIEAWRIPTPLLIRDPESALRPEKGLEFRSGHTAPVQCMIWLGTLQALATGGLDCTVRIFDFVQLRRTHVLAGHKKAVTCLEYCQKNQMLLSAGFDNYINIWDPSAGILSHTLLGHECSITGMCAVPKTDYEFMTVDFDGIVKLWDVRRLTIVQSFTATDRLAEMAGVLEPLEARTICPLSRDRVIIGGRRLVVFDRGASDPRLTADYSISGVAFNHNRIEIVTPVKNDLYLWCAFTGQLLAIHDNVIDGNITAVTLGIGERRIFIGADDGSVKAVNYACGAQVKVLTPHSDEVSQIVCIPSKVLSLSSPEKIIFIHDDSEPKRSVVLKKIDLSEAGSPILQIAHDGREMITGVSEEGDVFWYNMDFAKQVGGSETCQVNHDKAAVTCCRYFSDAPLIVSADSEGCLIFWSLRPLRMNNFFAKATLSLGQAAFTDPSTEAGNVGITALALAWPGEEFVFVGSERGALACIHIATVVDSAKMQRQEILRRKESGEAAEVISGRIFDSLPKPVDSPEYVFSLPNHWIVEGAHKGQIENIIPCERQPSVIVTLGIDACVRMWSHDTGEALGTLEQGLPEGLAYERESTWRFPIDAEAQVRRDLEALEESAKAWPAEEEEAKEPAAAATPTRSEKRRSTKHGSTTAGQQRGSARRPTRQTLQHAASAPDLFPGKRGSPELAKRHPLWRPKHGATPEDDWLAGPLSPSFAENATYLPKLDSGLKRPDKSYSKGIVDAARRLNSVLGSTPNGRDFF